MGNSALRLSKVLCLLVDDFLLLLQRLKLNKYRKNCVKRSLKNRLKTKILITIGSTKRRVVMKKQF